MPFKMAFLSEFTKDGFTASVKPVTEEPNMVNQQQINNIIINKENKKDKIILNYSLKIRGKPIVEKKRYYL